MQAGRHDQAAVLLRSVAAAHPRRPEVWRALALTLLALGDIDEAEAAIRAAIALDRRAPAGHAILGDLLRRRGRLDDAERAYRAALACDRLHPAAAPLARMLLASGCPERALQAVTPLAAAAGASGDALGVAALALKALGRTEEALAAQIRAVSAAPADAVAEHNLAATLGDLGRFAEATAATSRAFAKGLDAPETWLVRARALQGDGQLEAAEAAFREAIRQRPFYGEAQRELAQLVWMRTEDLEAATAALDTALREAPGDAVLRLHKAKVQAFADAHAAAYETLGKALTREPENLALLLAAAQTALALGEGERALGHAEKAVMLKPDHPTALTTLCEMALATGDAARANVLVEALRERAPEDQYVLALQATTWRLLGDARYTDLYDYGALVRVCPLAVPKGWTDMKAFLADLAGVLNPRHLFRTHPLDQSLRRGSQTTHLHQAADPALRALFSAFEAPIGQYIAALGKGRDPLRARSRGGRPVIRGSWSVRLRPGGFHVDHVHSQGWLSSAFYVELPEEATDVADAARPGWIRFGRPGVTTVADLAAEHFVRPEPGSLVLFPSYMWHGVNAFSGARSRLTVAFDVIPGRH